MEGRSTVSGETVVTYEDVARWYDSLTCTTRGAYVYRTSLRVFYRWAYKAGRVFVDPSLDLPTVRTIDQSRMPADDRDYADALSAAGEREELMLRLGAELGLRRAEIAQVHARDVHDAPDGAWLRVLGKGGKLRHLPLPGDLAELIRERAGRGFLGKITSNLLPQGVTLHALRHRFATRAYAVDRDVFAVQQLLGHARADTTQRYVRVPSSALRSTVTAAR